MPHGSFSARSGPSSAVDKLGVPHQMWDLMTWLCHPYLTSARPGRSSCRHTREVIWAKSRIHPVFSVSVGDCFFNSLGSFFNL